MYITPTTGNEVIINIVNRKKQLKQQVMLAVEHALNNSLESVPLNEGDHELNGLWVSQYNGEFRLHLGNKRLGYIML